MIATISRVFRPLLTVRTWPQTIAKALTTRVGIGTAILAITGVIYLEPHITGAFSCLGDMIQALATGCHIGWQCLADVLDDLREDGTAATVILAIAAAILASAWSSGSRSSE